MVDARQSEVHSATCHIVQGNHDAIFHLVAAGRRRGRHRVDDGHLLSVNDRAGLGRSGARHSCRCRQRHADHHCGRGGWRLGIGVAQTEDEFANLGVPYANRGAVTDEIIDALRVLWEQDVPAFSGAHYSFSGLRFAPKPLQSRLPILIGGNSPRALRRVREKGDGWHAMSLSVNEVRQRIAGAAGKACSMRLVLEFADTAAARPITERRTLKGPPAELIEQLRAYADAGIVEIVVDANSADLAATRACYQRFGNEVMSAL